MRHMKKIVLVLLAAVMILMLAGCGSTGPEGKWIIKSVDGQPFKEYLKKTIKEEYGDSITFEEYEAALKERGYASVEEAVSIEFKSDGTAVAKRLAMEYEGTWKLEGDTIIMDSDFAGHYEFKLKGKELILETPPNGQEVYVKQK